MNPDSKNLSPQPVSAEETPDPDRLTEVFESVLACKWSLHILTQVRRGLHRPSELRRSITGLSDKVLNERLHKMLRFGVLQRTVYPEAPPRVEYTLSPFGSRFAHILDQINHLREEMASSPNAPPPPTHPADR
ncbi:MAG: helix-turn-helix domain-containing protein [Planctomycetota bacterium]